MDIVILGRGILSISRTCSTVGPRSSILFKSIVSDVRLAADVSTEATEPIGLNRSREASTD